MPVTVPLDVPVGEVVAVAVDEGVGVLVAVDELELVRVGEGLGVSVAVVEGVPEPL